MGRYRWRDWPAAQWSYRLMIVQTALLTLAAVSAPLVGMLTIGLLPALAVALLVGALAGLWGWITSAWGREQPWAWSVLTVFSAVGLAWGVLGLLDGIGVRDVATLAGNGLMLALLLHPDSRACLQPPQPPARPPNGWAGPSGPTHPAGNWSDLIR